MFPELSPLDPDWILRIQEIRQYSEKRLRYYYKKFFRKKLKLNPNWNTVIRKIAYYYQWQGLKYQPTIEVSQNLKKRTIEVLHLNPYRKEVNTMGKKSIPAEKSPLRKKTYVSSGGHYLGMLQFGRRL